MRRLDNAYVLSIRLPCGTNASYKRGCRCDECRAANAAYTKAYRTENAEKVRARKLAYNQKNRAKEAARAKRWYQENSAAAKERIAQWQVDNRGKFLNYKRTRYAATHAEGKLDRRIDYEALWTGSCGICGGEMERDLPRGLRGSPTIDHIQPLSKGGSHVVENLQWAHMACNSGKGNR